MIFSRDRILTTHVGSLPRNEKLSDLLMAQEENKDYDPKVLTDEMDKAVRHAENDAVPVAGTGRLQLPGAAPSCSSCHSGL